VRQTIEDCLHETMDVDGFVALIKRIEDGSVEVVCRDLTGPSPLSHAVISARPYAFLDDGDAEGRRTRSINAQRHLEPQEAADLGRLDPDAIERVKKEAWPEIGTHDELHDALVVYGFLTAPEVEPWKSQLAKLREERRVVFHEGLWVAVERPQSSSERKAAIPRRSRRSCAAGLNSSGR
jgi:ATP-dependent Lhr-like helicase